MRIIIYDYSNRKNYILNSEIISPCLMTLDRKFWFGDVPLRVARNLISRLRKSANKNTSILVLIPDKTVSGGWKYDEIGSKSFSESFFKDFLKNKIG